MLLYLDENTYTACKEILEKGINLHGMFKYWKTLGWEIETQCEDIIYKSLVEKNLQEASELIAMDISGLPKGIDIIIDGESLFDRLTELEIDKDILYKQFSVMKFQKLIEDRLLRKSKKCIIAFSKEDNHYNTEVIRRLEREGIQVAVFENRLKTIDFVYEGIKKDFEFVVVSTREDMLSKVTMKKDNCYLYTVSFENDLPACFIPAFFSKGDITSNALNDCFNYDEGKTINIFDITESIYKDMLANANDHYSHQVRVDWSGNVYISTITGANEIDDVKFRWESWNPGNGYVGPRAASDYEYVKKSVDSLKKCWEDGVSGYCDYYAIF